MIHTQSTGDLAPIANVRVASVAELQDIVRRSASAGEAIYPAGGGTMADWGLPPNKPGTVVDLRGLDRVIDYPARDMTITVQAGITITRLQELLRAEGQQLPVDVPLPDRATLGGAIATNASGPRRFGYGTLRDYVIGITVVNDHGEEVHGGGRVVKNVAGYDLMKLYTGSLGTLGIISQVTLKVKPLPEAMAAIAIPCEASTLETILPGLANTATRPTMISAANGPAAAMVASESNAFTLVVGYEEKVTTVAWQVSRLNEELPAEVRGGISEFQGDLAQGLLRRWTDFPLATHRGLTFKANMLPAATASFIRLADRLEPQPLLMAHAGNGIVFGHLPPETTLEQAQQTIDALTRLVTEHAGNVVIIHCPPAWKSKLPVWGRPTPDRVIMRAVKQKLDPNQVFNPGRFIDGI